MCAARAQLLTRRNPHMAAAEAKQRNNAAIKQLKSNASNARLEEICLKNYAPERRCEMKVKLRFRRKSKSETKSRIPNKKHKHKIAAENLNKWQTNIIVNLCKCLCVCECVCECLCAANMVCMK